MTDEQKQYVKESYGFACELVKERYDYVHQGLLGNMQLPETLRLEIKFTAYNMLQECVILFVGPSRRNPQREHNNRTRRQSEF